MKQKVYSTSCVVVLCHYVLYCVPYVCCVVCVNTFHTNSLKVVKNHKMKRKLRTNSYKTQKLQCVSRPCWTDLSLPGFEDDALRAFPAAKYKNLLSSSDHRPAATDTLQR